MRIRKIATHSNSKIRLYYAIYSTISVVTASSSFSHIIIALYTTQSSDVAQESCNNKGLMKEIKDEKGREMFLIDF